MGCFCERESFYFLCSEKIERVRQKTRAERKKCFLFSSWNFFKERKSFGASWLVKRGTVDQEKSFCCSERPLEQHFMVMLSKIESILCLPMLLEIL